MEIGDGVPGGPEAGVPKGQLGQGCGGLDGVWQPRGGREVLGQSVAGGHRCSPAEYSFRWSIWRY